MQTQKATTGKANPLPVVLSLTVSARMRSICSCDTKKARDASPPPQDDLWVVVKNLSQQFAAQQTELATLSNAFALQQKTIADLEKINRDLEKVLRQHGKSDDRRPQTGAKPKRKSVATKPNPTTTTTATTTYYTDQPSKEHSICRRCQKAPHPSTAG
ncbi:hypothetical protein BASA83_000700 [Batrachochytrium salamandrivorans]|nr:hypothetical protein BASA83_000700 [Batrachochytrium salamandrivorans]